jgi:Zn-dependent M28 family amino/carboxypeptidase
MRSITGLTIRSICALLVLTIGSANLQAQQPTTEVRSLPADVEAALGYISADSLRGHLSFIASDLLEGRNTPSRGLDMSAEYIASQFRRAGLEPVGDDGYFQTVSSSDISLSRQSPELLKTPVKLRNVIGLLRGSDPVLKETYVIVTAHYDHIGTKPNCEGDCIYNGANDNGSGTVSIIEMASALARLKERPKRSIVFMTFFGEERGGYGSRYYCRNPIFPLEKTIANINLEHVGRTDSSEGAQLSRVSMTGFDYSDLSVILKQAAGMTGIELYKHEKFSNPFFRRSDNYAFAEKGVPAHSLSVAFDFPDYHGVGDHWEKIDYANMEKVVRMIALGLVVLANEKNAPKWNESNPDTAKFVEAQKAQKK